MQTLLISTFLLFVVPLQAQDYYAIQSEKQLVYYYPKKCQITVKEGNSISSNFELEKKYNQISVVTTWDTKPMVHQNATIHIIEHNDKPFDHNNTPTLILKKIEKSLLTNGTYNLEIEFSNSLHFEYKEGKVIAKQKERILEVKNKYLVATHEGLFKISFNPYNGAFWYVIDNKDE